MSERILRQLREKIKTLQYVVTVHAEEEIDSDQLTIFDVEHCILTGSIIERQRDRNSGETKFRVRGRTIDVARIEAIVKIGPTRKLFMITVYLL